MTCLEVLLVFFTTLSVGAGLECYSCSAAIGSHCLSNTVTCLGQNQVCYNIVFRRYSASVVYTKGCLDSTTCTGLASLNEDFYCNNIHSECTHCCWSSLCNTSSRPRIEWTSWRGTCNCFVLWGIVLLALQSYM